MIFDRVICGVDCMRESLEAVRQAARLVAADGRLLVVSVVDVDIAVRAGWAATKALEELMHEARRGVLVARPALDAGSFPSLRVVGFDGSPGSAAVVDAPSELKTRFGSWVRMRCSPLVVHPS
jgi:hypothetical protein